jgi:hypothetical protein
MSLWRNYLASPGRRKILAGFSLILFSCGGIFYSHPEDSTLSPFEAKRKLQDPNLPPASA